MNEQEALSAVKEALKPQRYEHTLRVTETAEQLCHVYGGNLQKIRLASILHDYAKYRSASEMRNTVKEEADLPDQLLDFGDELLHSFVGAFYVKKELGIADKDVLQMIASHTTGREQMSLEEEIVFLADYIEPGRTFPGAAEARKASKVSLEAGCLSALSQTITFLVSKRISVYPDTFAAYNYYIMKRKDDFFNGK
ncbi:bis(5'-nucleosyl)-tetraphosphatase (symmetrical) YqeK [Alkalicoccus daliensis]|uniref:bis(5'-nucleosyl)-tetraphosphatase (symmetrical) n=1 Tax=Alkalicoccus daliensis TaxID=745820 RepID=A0A1H0BFI3_9BACI|nr:bis(5'-nucleosyl)-tetraphosphatase (symmetrical) YqeK [Alkalicoccus daliensis]SDN44370.1 putative HD superfamily hydrolase of NAD metabolism [Alkalicoccus daliensis]